MIRRYVLPALAALGVVFAIFVVVKGNKPVPAAPPAAPPPEAPYREYVAGTGLVEASTQNIAVAANAPGVVTRVFAKVGDAVKAGTPLFTQDDRSLRATLAAQQAVLTQAQEKFSRLKAAPRPEEVPPAEALVKQEEANVADARTQYESAQSLGDSRAISREELTRRRFILQASESKLRNAQATLDLLKAGTWKADLDVAAADIALAEAQVKATQTAIDLLTVKAPMDGRVLQVNVRVGEYAQAGPLATPLMLFGDVDTLRVRVDVDENEAWRVRPGAEATAFVRGNRALRAPVHFEYIEPYVIPKKSLTGESTERVDTRVLQVIYSFDHAALPVYVGQQLDVFIDSHGAKQDAGAKP